MAWREFAPVSLRVFLLPELFYRFLLRFDLIRIWPVAFPYVRIAGIVVPPCAIPAIVSARPGPFIKAIPEHRRCPFMTRQEFVGCRRCHGDADMARQWKKQNQKSPNKVHVVASLFQALVPTSSETCCMQRSRGSPKHHLNLFLRPAWLPACRACRAKPSTVQATPATHALLQRRHIAGGRH